MLRSRLRILHRSRISNPNPTPNSSSDSSNNTKMDSIKLQFRPNSPHRFHLFSRNPKNSTNTAGSSVLIFASIAISFALFCFIFAVSTGYESSTKKKFSIVIDGGSTGTRIHVFEYEIWAGGVPSFDFGENGLSSMRVNPGLSAYADDPEGAGKSLEELVEFGKKKVPERYWAETEIRLMATAGLRMLDLGVQAQILGSCRRVLEVSGFKFRDDWASVITGSDEGMYAWVVANHALGTLGGDPLSTTGIIELGGASAQVTFVPSGPIPPEYSRIVRYGNITYHLYSHSLLQFGQNVAFDLLQDSLAKRTAESVTERLQRNKPLDPCTPSGYLHETNTWLLSPGSVAEKTKNLSSLHPRGNFSECRSAALRLLQEGKENCSYEHCNIGSTFIPKLHGKFLATENFFYTAKFFGLDQRAFISGLMESGQQFCEEDWPKLRKKYSIFEEDDLRRYCFSSAYIVALLHDSLGIAVDDERIGFANQVGDTPLDWALGAFILQSTGSINSESNRWIMSSIANDSSTLILLFAFAIILLFSIWFISKWRKPQLKTIYDLEKGKYIVSRVSRYS